MNKIFVTILIIIALGIGITAGYFWGFNDERIISNKKLNMIRPIRENNAGYEFIDPLLAYIIPPADQDIGLSSVKNKINDFISTKEKDGSLSNASLFFMI